MIAARQKRGRNGCNAGSFTRAGTACEEGGASVPALVVTAAARANARES